MVSASGIAQVVGLVHDHQPVPPHACQLSGDHRQREHLSVQPVFPQVLLPHGYQVLRTDDQRLPSLVLLQHSGDGGGHQGLSQTHHVADERTAPIQHDTGRDLDGRGLELEQLGGHRSGQPEPDQPLTGFLRQVVGHLQVDEVGIEQPVGGPRIVQHLDQFGVGRKREGIGPELLEPPGQLLGGGDVGHVHVQLALFPQPGAGQVG